jgi:hypothetical protein
MDLSAVITAAVIMTVITAAVLPILVFLLANNSLGSR